MPSRMSLQDDGHEVIKLGGDTGLIDRLRQSPLISSSTLQKAFKVETGKPISLPFWNF